MILRHCALLGFLLWLSASAAGADVDTQSLAVRADGQVVEGKDQPGEGFLTAEPSDSSGLSIISIADGVHVALSAGSAMAMIEAPAGMVIIDSLASVAVSARAMTAFRGITNQPVRGVVLTHLHHSHSGGLRALTADSVPVYSRAATVAGGQTNTIHFPHDTVRPSVATTDDPLTGIELRQPISHRHPVTIAGAEFELIAFKGNDSQQLWLWYPQKSVLFSGDAFYPSFPAIHALKNTVSETRDWLATLDTMLEKSPHFLVPSHGYPLIGQEPSVSALKHYRDAIALVLEETLAGIDRGLGPEALIEAVYLPPELASQPYLSERYARLPWAIRAIYANARGWFDGNSTTLDPLPPVTLAGRVAELAGGPEALLDNGLLALDNGDYQWAAQLADYLLSLDGNNAAAQHMKADALVALAGHTETLPARDYYLNTARQLRQAAAEQGPDSKVAQ